MPLNPQLLNYYLLPLHWSSLYYMLGCLSCYIFMHFIFVLKYFTSCQGSLSCWGNIKYEIYFNLQFIRFIILFIIYWMLNFCHNFFKHGLFSLDAVYQMCPFTSSVLIKPIWSWHSQYPYFMNQVTESHRAGCRM